MSGAGRLVAQVGGRDVRLEVRSRGGDRYRVLVDGAEKTVEAREHDGILLLRIGDEVIEAAVAREAGDGAAAYGSAAGRHAVEQGGERRYAVSIRGRIHSVILRDPLHATTAEQGLRISGPVELRSVMPGRIAAVLVEEGEVVAAGQGVIVVEAMKMENELAAPREGRIASIQVRRGDTVEAGALLLRID